LKNQKIKINKNKNKTKIYMSIKDNIENKNGSDVVTFELSPQSSIIIDPGVMIYMDGKLIIEPTFTSKNKSTLARFGSSIKKAFTGASFIDNQISNKTDENLEIALSPKIMGGITKLELLPGQVWKFNPTSFLACTSNIAVLGNINIFSNFKAALGGQNILYIELSTIDQSPGYIWVSSYGSIKKHEVLINKDDINKLYINDGNFLGILSEDKNLNINYWKECVNVGSANGFFKGLLTQSALLLKIQYNKNFKRTEDLKCIVYTQSLNIRNLDAYIMGVSLTAMNNASLATGIGMGVASIVFQGGEFESKYEKYNYKLENLSSNTK